MKLNGNIKTIGFTILSIMGYAAIIAGIIMTVLILKTIYSGN